MTKRIQFQIYCLQEWFCLEEPNWQLFWQHNNVRELETIAPGRVLERQARQLTGLKIGQGSQGFWVPLLDLLCDWMS